MIQALEYGLSRIELSNYFNSFEDYSLNIGALASFKYQINSALDALNQLKEKIYYKVPL